MEYQWKLKNVNTEKSNGTSKTTIENQWMRMNINGNQLESKKINENQWNCTQCHGFLHVLVESAWAHFDISIWIEPSSRSQCKKLLEDVQNVLLCNRTTRAINCEFIRPMAIAKPHFFCWHISTPIVSSNSPPSSKWSNPPTHDAGVGDKASNTRWKQFHPSRSDPPAHDAGVGDKASNTRWKQFYPRKN